MLKEVNREELQSALGKGVQLVVFFAEWCGPCKMYKQSLEALSEAQGIDILRVNIDKERDLSIEHRVSSIPLTEIYVDGQMVETASGYLPFEQIQAVVLKHF